MPLTAQPQAAGPATLPSDVATFSGGAGSWRSARRVAERRGTTNLTLLFTDTLLEDTDLYRFLIEAAFDVFETPAPSDLVAAASALPEFHEDEGARVEGLARLRAQVHEQLPALVWITEGRDPWTVFFGERFLGNSRFDPCSKILKREPVDQWLKDNRDPATTTVSVGIDWSEEHRFTRLRDRRAAMGWTYEAPLCEPPYLTKIDIFDDMRNRGIRRPRLYGLGLSHNNCGGGCIKAGQGHWARVLETLPEVYAWWEMKEQALRAHLGKDVSMLTDRRGDGKKKPLTLVEFRRRVESKSQVDMDDSGGCGCFADE